MFDKFVGESERKLRGALRTAESMAPCVLWIDEIEKGFSARAGAEADGGLARRIFGAFLSWLQDKKRPVCVVATANDIQAMPPELLRKGRFDEIFFVDLPNDAARRSILAVHLAKRGQDPAASICPLSPPPRKVSAAPRSRRRSWRPSTPPSPIKHPCPRPTSWPSFRGRCRCRARAARPSTSCAPGRRGAPFRRPPTPRDRPPAPPE